MSSLAVATLAREGIGEVTIANRTYERGARLAARAGVPARAIKLADLRPALAEADVIVSCTGATGLVITPEMIEKPAFILDLALPHDVAPGVRDIPGVTLVGLADLQAPHETPADADAVRRIVCEEVRAFQHDQLAATVAPTVVALRSKAAEVVEAELGRLGGRPPRPGDPGRGGVGPHRRRVGDKLRQVPTGRGQ